MNMHCMLFRSSSQKFPTQSLFANVLWQAKLFLLKKEVFEGKFCVVNTRVAQTHLSGRIATKWLRSYARKSQREAISFHPSIISAL